MQHDGRGKRQILRQKYNRIPWDLYKLSKPNSNSFFQLFPKIDQQVVVFSLKISLSRLV